jgi:hypothetical protein
MRRPGRSLGLWSSGLIFMTSRSYLCIVFCRLFMISVVFLVFSCRA